MTNLASSSKKKSLPSGLLLSVSVVLLLLFPHANLGDPPQNQTAEATIDAYGINWSAYDVEDKAVRRNQTFSAILAAHNVPSATINGAIEKARPIINLRSIRAGKPLRIYQDAAQQTARVVVYEPTPETYVVFDLRDTLKVYEGRHPVTVKRRAASGVITASPYQTLEAQGANPALAVYLSKVFAWQIDFYRIQRGDRFHVIYEEREVAGKPVGPVKILAARFEHAGTDYYAFAFGEDEAQRYYDELGVTLRRTFLKAPLDYSRISSRYTKRRFHPVLKRYKAHLGTDYAAPTGTPIRATADGVVTNAAYTRGNGRYVKIKHNDTYTTGYLHMSRIGKGIRPGRTVRQGDVIGYVGSTGLATGPHLCYRFWLNGKQVDPLKLNLPTAEPIDAAQYEAFSALRNRLMPLLLLPETPPAQVVELPAPPKASAPTLTAP